MKCPGDIVEYARRLRKCISTRSLVEGKVVHAQIIKNGVEPDIYLANNLLSMYAKCNSVENARQVFDKMLERNTISWTAMIAGYAQNDLCKEALKLCCQMQRTNLEGNDFTFASVLRACARIAALEQGKQIHARVIGTEFEWNVIVGSALVDMYAKCRRIEDAQNVFDKMPERDAVSWNAIIAGFAVNGQGEEALKHFCFMQNVGIKPYQVTFSSVLKACAGIVALEQGKQIHTHIIKTGSGSDIFVGSALVDMYAKCGRIQDADYVFAKIVKRDVVSWNAMIAGYANHGLGKKALQLFEQMQQEGMKPNGSTFVSVLTACSHGGLVDEGRYYFNSIFRNHEIMPSMEHYACVVDLLGRAGCLGEAREFIKQMPFEPGAVLWRTLLGACRVHGNVEVAEYAAQHIFKLYPDDTATWMLLSNVYAAACRWDDVAKVRKDMKDGGLIKKKPGSSWIQVKGNVHTFVIGDRSHPQVEEIYAKLEALIEQIREAGYIPNPNFELHDLEHEHKLHSLSHHSEKLALAFGLISTPSGVPIQVINNLRTCGDCHTAMKQISKTVGRKIILRDATRFHHFQDGMCSCGDYW